MNCNICTQPSKPFGTATVLHKHRVDYFACPNCRFIQTETPHWLDEAYSNALSLSDVGGVRRNHVLATITSQIIRTCFPADTIGLDYGGGHGLFVRMMRDLGYPFEWQDAHAENIYARGFEQSQTNNYAIVTAFELFEHLVDPHETIKTLLTFSDSILFTTELVAETPPPLEKWWYYSLDYGQHVSLYSLETLQYIAHTYQLNLYTNRSNIHLLTRRTISARQFRWLARYKVAFALSLLSRRRSLVEQDYERLTGQRLDA